MPDDDPQGEDANGDGGGNLAAEHHKIALGIETLRKTYESAQEDRAIHDKKTLFWSRIAGVGVAIYTFLTIGIVLASIYSAHQAKISADAAQSSVKSADDTEVRELRAYVYLTVSDFLFPEERRDESGVLVQKPKMRGIVLNLVNSGKTWAQNLVVRRQSIPEKGDGDHWKEIEWDKLTASPIVLGPGQHFGLQLDNILISDMPSITNETKGVQYYVWITYDDVFGTQPRPQTQLAVRLNADLDGAYGHLSYAFLPPHNCADEYCPK